MRQILFILIAAALCFMAARLLPSGGEMSKTLRAVFYTISAAFGLLFLYALGQAVLG